MADYDLVDTGDTFRPWNLPFQQFPEERIGIVANSDVSGELEACRRYADAHGIPRANIVSIAATDKIEIATGLPNDAAIYERFVAPVREHANEQRLLAHLAGPTIPQSIQIPSSPTNYVRTDEILRNVRLWKQQSDLELLPLNAPQTYMGKVNLDLNNLNPAEPSDLRDAYWPPMAAKSGPGAWTPWEFMRPEYTAMWGRPGGALAIGKIGWWQWNTYRPFNSLEFVDTLNERYLAARSRSRAEALALPHIVSIRPVTQNLHNSWAYWQAWLRNNLGMSVKWDVVAGDVTEAVEGYLDPAYRTAALDSALVREPAYFVVGVMNNYSVYPPWNDPYIAQRFAAQLGGGLIASLSFPYLEGGWMIGGDGNLGLCTQTTTYHITTTTATFYPSIYTALLRGMSWLEANAYAREALGAGDPLFRPYPGGLNYSTGAWDASLELTWPVDWENPSPSPGSASWEATAGAASVWS